jgi:transposase InsO family protein
VLFSTERRKGTDAATKVARQRLSVLQLAEALGNAAEACRRRTPGELLCADTFFVGSLKGVGKVYLHAVVDTFGSYAFGFLHVSKQPEAAVAVLHNEVLPFYRELDLPVHAVLTDNGREFCGTEQHPYELYLALNDIEHRRTRVRTPKTNGFVERFNGTVLDEFFRAKMRDRFYDSVEALQSELSQQPSHSGCASGPWACFAIWQQTLGHARGIARKVHDPLPRGR